MKGYISAFLPTKFELNIAMFHEVMHKCPKLPPSEVTPRYLADPYTDYVPQGEVPGSGLQIFPRCARKYCRSIQIIADSEDEETEEFRVSIDLSFYNEDLPIQILDDGSNAAIKIQPTNKSEC